MLPGTENKGCDGQAGGGSGLIPAPGTPLLWLVLPEPGQRLVCSGLRVLALGPACYRPTAVHQLLLYFWVPQFPYLQSGDNRTGLKSDPE